MFPVSLASISHSSPSMVELVLNGKPVTIKGTSSGKIMSSHDGGRSWEICADFGVDCPVIQLHPLASGVSARIGHNGYSFTLHSVDGRQWIA